MPLLVSSEARCGNLSDQVNRRPQTQTPKPCVGFGVPVLRRWIHAVGSGSSPPSVGFDFGFVLGIAVTEGALP